MTDYSQMSDQEINQEVTCILNPDAQKMALIGDGSCFYDCGPDGNGFYEIPILDYCNNPADAWQIILKNGINVFTDMIPHGLLGQARASVVSHEPPNCEFIIANDANPLRAAMIVFLMMQDPSNANPI